MTVRKICVACARPFEARSIYFVVCSKKCRRHRDAEQQRNYYQSYMLDPEFRARKRLREKTRALSGVDRIKKGEANKRSTVKMQKARIALRVLNELGIEI